MAKFRVDCTMIYNGCMEVEVDDEVLALQVAQDNLCHELGDDFPDDGKFGLAQFSFGEATADYAYPEEEEYMNI